LAAGYRSPEPVVLAVAADGGEAALATRDGEALGPSVERIARELEGDADVEADETTGASVEYDIGPGRGYLRLAGEDTELERSTVITAAREVL
ncbi:hypothetical protein C446_11092, partial [Halobiforma nitratireducens JCM 10879]